MDLAARMAEAGVPAATEGYHVHDHLDVFLNGQPVTVPAQFGIDHQAGLEAGVHTHDTKGVLHIEAKNLHLGQFFTMWGIPLDEAQIYVNGKAVADGGDLPLTGGHEIAVIFGAPPDQIPSTYGWN